MDRDMTLSRNDIYGMMENDKPYAAYMKKILGKVVVTIWDNILEKPIERVLVGNPRTNDEGCIVRVWSAKEDLFFKRNNVKQLKNGNIVSYNVPETPAVEEKTIEQATDEELAQIVNSKYMALKAKLNEITSVAVLYRMLSIAEDLEKSEKITNPIKARISELQTREYPTRLEVEPIVPEEE